MFCPGQDFKLHLWCMTQTPGPWINFSSAFILFNTQYTNNDNKNLIKLL